LKDQDQVQDKLRERARLQLFGHKHTQRCEEIDRKSVKLVAGAMHPDQREPDWNPVYNILALTVTEEESARFLEVRIEPRAWSKSGLSFGPDAGENAGVRIFKLKLEPSTQPPLRVEATQLGPKPNVQPEPSKPEETKMNARRLTYRFLSLPFTKQMEVAQSVDLLEPNDKGIQDQQLFQLFFMRARDRNLVEKLASAIDAAQKGNH